MLSLISYPLGTVLGIVADRILFEKVGALFSGEITLMEVTHRGKETGTEIFDGVAGSEIFYVDWTAVLSCAIFMLFLLLLISLFLSKEVSKKTVMGMMTGENRYLRNGNAFRR